MSKVFHRKQFSNYLGEQRAIDDIFSQFIPDPSPTPSPLPLTPTPTPSVTPTMTVTPSITPTLTSSPTPTPSITPTLTITPTVTITPTPSITPTLTPTPSITPTLTPTPSPFPTYSFSGAVYDSGSTSGACSSVVVVDNLWGLNPVWSGNTGLWSDSLATVPTPAGFYNYNGVVLEVIPGGGVPNPPYECPPLFDPDAQAFFDAITTSGGTLNSTEENAINDLVIDLKGYGLWNKMIGLYPVVGTTSVTQSFNLKDPTTYNLGFNGTWAHTAGGAEPSAANGYARTGIIPSVINFQASGSIHYSMYITENTTNAGYELGTSNNGQDFGVISNYSNNITYMAVGSGNFTTANGGSTKKNFLWTNSGGTSTIYTDGVSIGSASYAINTGALTEMLISGINVNGTPVQFTGRNWALASIGLGMSSIDATNYNTAVVTFQTALSRQN